MEVCKLRPSIRPADTGACRITRMPLPTHGVNVLETSTGRHNIYYYKLTWWEDNSLIVTDTFELWMGTAGWQLQFPWSAEVHLWHSSSSRLHLRSTVVVYYSTKEISSASSRLPTLRYDIFFMSRIVHLFAFLLSWEVLEVSWDKIALLLPWLSCLTDTFVKTWRQCCCTQCHRCRSSFDNYFHCMYCFAMACPIVVSVRLLDRFQKMHTVPWMDVLFNAKNE
jgi:hypothetical protein